MFTISIVTKTFNRLDWLLENIESVQFLKLEPYEQDVRWEHVIYDDGSTDGTSEHFQKHSYPHVRYMRSTINKGISKAANTAIASCQSEYIFELDSDDLVPQRALANCYHTLREYPQADWMIADFFSVNKKHEYLMGQDYYGWNYKNPKEMLTAIFKANHFIQHNVVYRKKLWEDAGGYDEHLTMAEDLDLFIRFLLRGCMPAIVPYISHFHRVHDTNISRDVTLAHHQQDLAQLYLKYEEQLANMNIVCPFL